MFVLQACASDKEIPQSAPAEPPKVEVENSLYPKQLGFVNDYVQLFTDDQKQKLDSLLTDFEKRTGVEMAVAILDSSRTTKDGFFKYTVDLANYWGVGKSDENNGVLFIFAPQLRMLRVNTGTGIENILKDEAIFKILDNKIFPQFKKDKMFQGTWDGVLALMALYDRQIKQSEK